MGINWKVRIQNPLWWTQMICAVLLPILAYFGLNWEDVTSWTILGNLLIQAVKNPVVLVSVAVSIFNALNDPTTSGLRDSIRAMGYSKPYKDGEV